MKLRISIDNFIYDHAVLTSIILCAFVIIESVGIAKMYEKLGMPGWTKTVQILYPILVIINSFVKIGLIISIVEFIRFLALLILYKVLGCERVELKSIMPIIAIILGIVGIVCLFIIKAGIFISLIYLAIIFIIIVAFAFYIKLCKHLAEHFDKGKGFEIGLIILPSIFQPILGYMKD